MSSESWNINDILIVVCADLQTEYLVLYGTETVSPVWWYPSRNRLVHKAEVATLTALVWSGMSTLSVFATTLYWKYYKIIYGLFHFNW